MHNLIIQDAAETIKTIVSWNTEQKLCKTSEFYSIAWWKKNLCILSMSQTWDGDKNGIWHLPKHSKEKVFIVSITELTYKGFTHITSGTTNISQNAEWENWLN